MAYTHNNEQRITTTTKTIEETSNLLQHKLRVLSIETIIICIVCVLGCTCNLLNTLETLCTQVARAL